MAKVVADRYQGERSTPLLICSTAHFAKFSDVILGATQGRGSLTDDLDVQFNHMEQLKCQPAMHERLKRDVLSVENDCEVIDAQLDSVVDTVSKVVQDW